MTKNAFTDTHKYSITYYQVPRYFSRYVQWRENVSTVQHYLLVNTPNSRS